MQADNLSRGLLAAILVCFVLLVVEHRSAGEDASESAPGPSAAIERFEVRPIAMRRGPPLLLRLDTATGEAWTMGLMDKSAWEPLTEGSAGVPEPDADGVGRFSIRAHNQSRGLPTLVRLDSVTGRIWRKGSKTPRPWVAVPNPGSESSPATAPAAAASADAAGDSATADAEDEELMDDADVGTPDPDPEDEA
jgi:hypothetical protein